MPLYLYNCKVGVISLFEDVFPLLHKGMANSIANLKGTQFFPQEKTNLILHHPSAMGILPDATVKFCHAFSKEFL
jgi:hypothetical protein